MKHKNNYTQKEIEDVIRPLLNTPQMRQNIAWINNLSDEGKLMFHEAMKEEAINFTKYNNKMNTLQKEFNFNLYKKIYNFQTSEAAKKFHVYLNTAPYFVKELFNMNCTLIVQDCGEDTNENELSIKKDGSEIAILFYDRTTHNANFQIFGIMFDIETIDELKSIFKSLKLV